MNYANEWGVHESKVTWAFTAVATCIYWPEDVRIQFAFLLSKGVNESTCRRLFYDVTENEEVPIDVLSQYHSPHAAIGPYMQWWLLSDHAIARKAQSTLRQLLFRSDMPSEIPADISFGHFVDEHPEWREGFVFFRDYPMVKDKPGVLIQRRQLSGNCYIHGPIVTHHYHLCKHIDTPVAIGVREFILRDLSTPLLSKLIASYGGGSSEAMFRMLLHPQSREVYRVTNFDDVIHKVQTLGPGLLAGFQIEARFRDDGVVNYEGPFTSDVESSHSMCAIGFRRQGTKTYVLVQNWWHNKQFVAIDDEYFYASGATAIFPKHPVRTAPERCHLTTAEYAEAVMGGQDLAPEEVKSKVV